jgi:epoxide hydrolase-like predicted phosphatase
MKYKAIGFDYGGVIAGIPSSEFNRRITGLLDVTPEVYRSVYFANNHLLNHDKLSKNDFWAKILNELGRSEKINDLLHFLESLNTHQINFQVLDLAKQLKIKGYKIGILSNNTSEGVQKMKEAGLMEIFDVVAVSTEIGFIKPDPRAFGVFIDQLGVPAQELVFIDDTARSLESSVEVGFYPVKFNNFTELLDSLAEIDVV